MHLCRKMKDEIRIRQINLARLNVAWLHITTEAFNCIESFYWGRRYNAGQCGKLS